MDEHISNKKRSVPVSVLLADDDARLLIELTLRRHRPAVKLHAFPSGDLLLDYLALSPFLPAMILLDLHMPTRGGVAIYPVLQGHRWHKTIPVLILTGSDNRQELARHYGLAAGVFYTKPSTVESLATMLLERLAGLP